MEDECAAGSILHSTLAYTHSPAYVWFNHCQDFLEIRFPILELCASLYFPYVFLRRRLMNWHERGQSESSALVRALAPFGCCCFVVGFTRAKKRKKQISFHWFVLFREDRRYCCFFSPFRPHYSALAPHRLAGFLSFKLLLLSMLEPQTVLYVAMSCPVPVVKWHRARTHNRIVAHAN